MEALVILPSSYALKETMDRLVVLLERLGMTIYVRINRQIESKRFGIQMPPMECLLFDDPRLSVPVVTKDPPLGLCFPMMITVWEENGCRIAFKDPAVLSQMHDPDAQCPRWPDLRAELSKAIQN